ncbi:hypothetical protein D9M69_543870 [compost metagenome]
MYLVLCERVHDVVHALARVGRVARLGEARCQFLERLERFLGGLLVALGQVLARQEREHAQVVVEVDHALQVERVVERRAGRVQLHEAVERGDGVGLFAGLVLGVGLFELGLLGQRRAGGTAFELLVQRHCLVVGAGADFVLGFRVDAVGAPVRGLVFLGGGTATGDEKGRRAERDPGRDR